MKNLVVFLALIIFVISNAQIKEGTITYLEETQLNVKKPTDTLPEIFKYSTQTKIFFKDKKMIAITVNVKDTTKAFLDLVEKKGIKDQIFSALKDTSKTFVSDNYGVVLLNIKGNKSFLKIKDKELENYKNPELASNDMPLPTIDYLPETKTILGYECNKAEFTLKNDEIEFKTSVWYTDKVKTSPIVNITMGGMDYFLKNTVLEYTISKVNSNTGFVEFDVKKVTVKSISTDLVPESIFNVSTDGYTEIKFGGQ